MLSVSTAFATATRAFATPLFVLLTLVRIHVPASRPFAAVCRLIVELEIVVARRFRLIAHVDLTATKPLKTRHHSTRCGAQVVHERLATGAGIARRTRTLMRHRPLRYDAATL